MNKGRIAMIGGGGLAVAGILSALHETPEEKRRRQLQESRAAMLQVMKTTQDPAEYNAALQSYENASWVLQAEYGSIQ